MGISLLEAALLKSLKTQNEVGDEILSLGRPGLFLSRRHLNIFHKNSGLDWSDADIDAVLAAPFADPFLKHLGFKDIRSLDYSDYQGAEIIHDMNQPIPEELEGATDFLFAGGTIEHIFDIRTVMRNMTRLLRTGGTLALSTPQNGYGGHGFYQFSPEFFYRYFECNGFEDARVYIVGTSYPPKWFLAVDPRQAGRRIEFTTMEPTLIVAVARKVTDLAQDVIPQQSDYEDGSWTESTEEFLARLSKIQHHQNSVVSKLKKRASISVGVASRYLFGSGMPGASGHPAFKPVDPFGPGKL